MYSFMQCNDGFHISMSSTLVVFPSTNRGIKTGLIYASSTVELTTNRSTLLFAMMLLFVYFSAVAKASSGIEMKERSELAAVVVYESVEEGRFPPGEVLTDSPLYQSHGTVETNPVHGLTTRKEQSK